MRAAGSIVTFSGGVSYFGMRLRRSCHNLCIYVCSDFCANNRTGSTTTQTLLRGFQLTILIYEFLTNRKELMVQATASS